MEKNPESKTGPYIGVWKETLSFVRKKIKEGEMTAEEGLRLSELAYRNEMLNQLFTGRVGVAEETPGEWPPKET